MKEIRTSGPLMFSDPNCPTRVGEIINTISEIYDIPNPCEGMQVYVRDEKKTYTITGLKEAIIGGERVPNVKVDTFEAVKSKVEEIDNNFAEMRDALSDGSFLVGIANLANAVKAGAITFEMLNGKLRLSASVVDNLETANTLMPLSANQGKVLNEKINNIKPVIYEGSTINNAPDEEDITSENELLKLKDRAFGNGLGYIIMRKGREVSEQLARSTIVEIRYDFDLEDDSITIPDNCILFFNGGFFRNGAIKANNAYIIASRYQIFDDISIEGVFNGDGYAEWFGASLLNEDNRLPIQQCVDSFKTTILDGMFKVASAVTGEENEEKFCISIPKGHTIKGEKLGDIDADNDGIHCSVDNCTIIKVNNGCKVRNLHLKGYNRDSGAIGIGSSKTHSITVDNVLISNVNIGIKMSTFLTSCNRVECWYNNTGFAFAGTSTFIGTSVNLSNCYAAYNRYRGYSFDYMTYSSLTCCACDSTGRSVIDGSVINKEDIAIAYEFINTNGISIQSCGAERNRRLFKCDNSSSISVISSYFLVGDNDIEENDLKRHIIIKMSRNVAINNCNILFESAGYTGTYVYLDDYRDNITAFSTNCIPQSRIQFYDNGISGIVIEKIATVNIPNTEIKKTLVNYPFTTLRNATRNATLTYDVQEGSTAIRGIECVDCTNSAVLRFVGGDNHINNIIVIDSKTPLKFEGFRKVVFENIVFQVSSYWGDGYQYLMEFIDTDAEFINCVFFINGVNTRTLLKGRSITWVNTCEYSYGSLRRDLSNIKAIFDFNNLESLTGYNQANRVLLPTGAVVKINDVNAIVVGENANITYNNNILDWINNNGMSIGVKKGMLSQRPNAVDIDVPIGYMYLWEKTEPDDITGGQTPTGEVVPIWWNGSDWQDATGQFIASGTIRE